MEKTPKINKSFSNFTSAVAALFTIAIFSTASAYTLSQPKVESSIGEPLNVFIPVLNNSGKSLDINNIEATLASSTNKLPKLTINKDIARSGLVVSSQQSIKDVVVDLNIKTIADNNARFHNFTILLDPINSTLLSTPIKQEEIILTNPSQGSFENINTGSATTMAPTDFISSRTTPKQFFGPVIEGQALWRVARRIKKAYGISSDKMSWNLYKSNPQAFQGNSIDSLIAGSILTIPRESELVDLPESALTSQKTEVTESETIADVIALVEENTTQTQENLTQPEAEEESSANLIALNEIKSELENVTSRLEYLHNQQSSQNERLSSIEATTIDKEAQQFDTSNTLSTVIADAEITESNSSFVKNTTKKNSGFSLLTLLLTSILSFLAGCAAVLWGKDIYQKTKSVSIDFSKLNLKSFRKKHTPKITHSPTINKKSRFVNGVDEDDKEMSELLWVPQPKFKSPRSKNTTSKNKKSQLADDKLQDEIKALEENQIEEQVLEKYKIGNDILASEIEETVIQEINENDEKEQKDNFVIKDIQPIKDDENTFIILEDTPNTPISIVSGGEDSTVFNTEATSNSSIEFDEDFSVINEKTISIEELQLIDLIESLSDNREFETAHSILDNSGDTYDVEHITYCRLKLYAEQEKYSEFNTLYKQSKSQFDRAEQVLIDELKKLKKSVAKKDHSNNNEGDVIEFTKKTSSK